MHNIIPSTTYILFNKQYRLHNYELIDLLSAHLRFIHFITNILIYRVGFKNIFIENPELKS